MALNFTSPGAAAGNAIQDFLIQRALQQRQAMLDQQAQQEKAQADQRAADELKLRQQQESRVAEAQKATIADAENQRQFQRANTIAENALPGDAVDDPTRALLAAQGFGGQINKTPGIVAQGPQLGTDESGVPQYQVNQSPDTYQLRGGNKYIGARVAAEEKAAEAERARADADQRAASDRELRREIAAGQNAGAAETRGLRNDILRTQVEAAKQKQSDAETAKTNATASAQRSSQDVMDVIRQLADVDPKTGQLVLKDQTRNLFGARNPIAGYIPGSDTATASAAMDRLLKSSVINMIEEMKSQSKTGATGFGRITQGELPVLQNAATTLGHSLISDDAARAELQRLYDSAARTMSGGSSTAAAGGGAGQHDGWTTLPNGVRIREKR